MAMRAGLVALAPDVDLQRLKLSPPQGQAVLDQFGFKTIHVSEGENAGVPRIFRKNDRRGHLIQSDTRQRALPAAYAPYILPDE